MVSRAFGDHEYKLRTARDSTYESGTVGQQIAAANAKVASMKNTGGDGAGGGDGDGDGDGGEGPLGSGEPKLSLGGELYATDGSLSSIDGGAALSTTFFEISDDSADEDDANAADANADDTLSQTGSSSGLKNPMSVHGVSEEFLTGPVIAEPELQVSQRPVRS